MNPFVADPAWGWWIIFYFFLGGLAAGCYFLATLIELFGHEEDRPLARIGYRLAFPLILVCGVLLIVDLEKPERFWHMVLQSEVVDQALAENWPLGGWGTMFHALMLKWWSPMSVGAQALGIFGLCSFVSFLGSLWPTGRLARLLGSRLFGRAFKVLGCVVGFFIAAYTGALLTATNQPLWSGSDWIAALFLTSAASTSIALVLLLGRHVSEASRQRLELADLWALGLELFVFLIFLASLGGVLPLALATWEGCVLVFGTLIIGLLVPLWLHLGFDSANPQRVTAAAASALAGGFMLRFGIVRVAPALLKQFPYTTGGAVPLESSAIGLGLVAVTLALGVTIPLVLRRRRYLSMGQTVLAGLVSVAVLAAVSLYTFTPADAQPSFPPLHAVRFSPEDDRPRDGGPGASGSNRPVHPHPQSKIPVAPVP